MFVKFKKKKKTKTKKMQTAFPVFSSHGHMIHQEAMKFNYTLLAKQPDKRDALCKLKLIGSMYSI